MNTKISYTYRDDYGRRVDLYVIVKGELPDKEIGKILSCRYWGQYFVPCQVGFPEQRFADSPTPVDDCWFELGSMAFEFTDEAPTIDLTAKETVERFEKAVNDGWDETAWLNHA